MSISDSISVRSAGYEEGGGERREGGGRKEGIFTQVVFSAWTRVCDEIGDLIGVLLSNRTYRS